MTEESKRIEYWNFLTTEKNQPRPKGLTVHRLAVIKPLLISQDDLWSQVIEGHGARALTAAEFCQSGDLSSVLSRTDFWDAVRGFILREDRNRNSQNESPKFQQQKTLNRNNYKKQLENKRQRRRPGARHSN
jgi:hypothetical protein